MNKGKKIAGALDDVTTLAVLLAIGAAGYFVYSKFPNLFGGSTTPTAPAAPASSGSTAFNASNASSVPTGIATNTPTGTGTGIVVPNGATVSTNNTSGQNFVASDPNQQIVNYLDSEDVATIVDGIYNANTCVLGIDVVTGSDYTIALFSSTGMIDSQAQWAQIADAFNTTYSETLDAFMNKHYSVADYNQIQGLINGLPAYTYTTNPSATLSNLTPSIFN